MDLQKIAEVGEQGDADYFWKSDHEVLWLRHATQHDKPPLRVSSSKWPPRRPPAPGHYEAVVLDIPTQTWQALEAFNARSAPLLTAQIMYVHTEGEADFDLHHHPPTCALSPDGMWLVWHSLNVAGKPGWIAATLDGERQLTWPGKRRQEGWCVGRAVWKNNAEWIELLQKYEREKYFLPGARLRRTDDPDALQSLRFSDVPDALLLGLTVEERLLWYEPEQGQATISSVRFREVGLNPALAYTWDYNVALPEANHLSDVALSPQGTHLAWILGGISQTPNEYTLWISDRRGKQFQRLGQWPGIPRESAPHTHRRYDWPRSLRWRPSGNQVSFLYENSLCAVTIA